MEAENQQTSLEQAMYDCCTAEMEARFNRDFQGVPVGLRRQYLLRILNQDTYKRLVTKVTASVSGIVNTVNSIAREEHVSSSVRHQDFRNGRVVVNPKVVKVPTVCREPCRAYTINPLIQVELAWKNCLGSTASVAVTMVPASRGGLTLVFAGGAINSLIGIDFPFRKALVTGCEASGSMMYSQCGYSAGHEKIAGIARKFSVSTKSYEYNH